MRRVSPYLKMQVLGAIDFVQGETIAKRIKAASEKTFTDESGNTHRFTWRTINTWYYRFKVHGTTDMLPNSRSDKGKPRKISLEELNEAIQQVLPLFRNKKYNATAIYRTCIEKGIFRREQLSRTSFHRLTTKFDLLKPIEETQNKRRLAFSKLHANQLWQADTMIGPYISHKGKKEKAKLIAFIDDASRIICHGEFFINDNAHSLMKALQTAIYKRGIPEQIYVDNGSNYRSEEMGTICAKIGCILSHAPVHDGAAKGKIERFFRTVRESFLIKQLDLSSLEKLNRQFHEWVETRYNGVVHSTINMKPIDRFGLDLDRIRFLPPNQSNDELFFIEKTRSVRKDNTFSFDGINYEAPRDLRSRKIEIRYDRSKKDRVLVFYKEQRMGEAHPLNYQANDRKSHYNK